MNTLAFAFGVLSVVAVIFIATIVLGIVKVIKQQKQIKDLQDMDRNLSDHYDKRLDELEQRISEEVRLISDETFHIHRLMDSRFDKFEDKITKKQILKN